jgi:hypothetical protein
MSQRRKNKQKAEIDVLRLHFPALEDESHPQYERFFHHRMTELIGHEVYTDEDAHIAYQKTGRVIRIELHGSAKAKMQSLLDEVAAQNKDAGTNYRLQVTDPLRELLKRGHAREY